MSKHVVFLYTKNIYMGQGQNSTFFFPQYYSHWKPWYINLSTELYTLSTSKKVFIHIVHRKTNHYIL